MSFANWLYKQTHSITHPTGVTDYQIKFTVYKGVGSSTGSSIYLNNHCKDDFSDVRFSIDNSTSLSYWIESYTSGVSAVIWVKFASILTTTVSIYYGNVLVTSESNGVNTFILFDDFLGSSLDTTTNWTLDAGSVTVTGGTAVVASGARFESKLTWNYNVKWISKFKYAQPASLAGQIGFGNWSAAKYNNVGWYYDPSNHFWLTRQNIVDTYNAITGAAYNTYVTYTAAWASGSAKYYIGDALDRTHTTNVPSGTYPLMIDARSNITIDFIAVAKYNITEPTQGSYTSEQIIGSLTSIILTPTPSSGTAPLTTSINVTLPVTLTNFQLLYGDGQSYIPSDATTWSKLYYTNSTTGYEYYRSARTVITGLSLSGSRIKIKLNGAATTGDITIYHASIVERSGTTSNGTTAPTQLKFNGNDGIVISSGSYIYTDEINYTIDSAKSYLLTIDFYSLNYPIYGTDGGVVREYLDYDYTIKQETWNLQTHSYMASGNYLSIVSEIAVVAIQESFTTSHTYNTFGTYQVYASGYSDATFYNSYTSVIASNNSLTASFTKLAIDTGQTIYNPIADGYSNISSVKTIRNVLSSSNILRSGDYVRFKLNTGLAVSNVTNIAIVERSSNTSSGTTTPTLLTINGSSTYTIPINGSIWTDWKQYPIDKTKSYLLIVDFATYGSYNVPRYEGSSYQGSPTSATSITMTNGIFTSKCIMVSEVEVESNKYQFTDTSIGTPNEYYWMFGDGSYSTTKNPIHIYNTPGTYTITLYASNQQYNGVTTSSITVANPTPSASITTYQHDDLIVPCHLSFTPAITTNDSLNESISSYSWTLNSLPLSSSIEPSHYFTNYGAQVIGLTVTNNYGVTYTTSTTITLGALPVANFSPSLYNVVSPTLPYSVQFNNLSWPTDIPSTTYSWNFGDSVTSTTYSPLHPYTTIGSYDVSLTITNPYGSDTALYPDAIRLTRKSKTFVEVTGCADTFTSFKVQVFNEMATTNDVIVYAHVLDEAVGVTQHEIPDEPGVDEWGIVNIYNSINEFGSRVYSTLNEWGHKILRAATFSDHTGFTIYHAQEFREDVSVTVDCEQQ